MSNSSVRRRLREAHRTMQSYSREEWEAYQGFIEERREDARLAE